MLKQGLSLFLTLMLLFTSVALARADAITLSQTVQAGETAVYSISLHNQTDASHDYALALTGLPAGMKATITQGGPVIDHVTIPAQDAGQLFIRIETTRQTPVGSYDAQFVATRDDGDVLQMSLTLVVENTYALQIVSQNTNASVFSGKDFNFDVIARNSGAAPLDNVTLQVDAPAKWIVQTDPAQVARLAEGETVTFHAHVITPPSQTAIDQPLALTIVSDQVSSDASELVVRVQKSPSYLFASAGVMLFAVGGAFVYFRRQGRR